MTIANSPQQASPLTPVRVVAWTSKSERGFIAVCAPETPDDPNPWLVYEGSRFIRRISEVPAAAKVEFPGTVPETTVQDGAYYEVVVDARPGIGVRNSPLNQQVHDDKPWVVSLHDPHRSRLSLDVLPDHSVSVVRMLTN
jgi:hypothetical protein